MTARDSLGAALRLAERGWYPIPLLPLTKTPAVSGYYTSASLDPDELTERWESASARTRQIAARHPNYTDIAADIAAVAGDHHPVWADMEPGVGVILGRSRLAVVDADTPAQVAAWTTVCERNGYDPGPRTVATPGVIKADGTHKHHDGGHWYYRVPEGIPTDALARTGIKLPLGLGGVGQHADLMTGNRFVVVPPTARPEGPYIPTAGAKVPAMPPFLADVLGQHVAAAASRRAKAGVVVHDDRLWAWDTQTDWLDVLPQGWKQTGTEPDGCVVFAHPEASTRRSAIGHVPGCSHLPESDGITPPPLTFFTTTLPDWITAALSTTEGGQSASKLKLHAFKHFGGDMRRARAMLGLQQPKAAPRQRTSAPASIERWTVHHRPMPALASAAPSQVPMSMPTAAPESPAPEPSAPPTVSSSRSAPLRAEEERRPAAPAEFIDVDPTCLAAPRWEPPRLAERAVGWVSARAEDVVPEVWDRIERIERESGRYAGRDDQPEAWTETHKRIRAERADLLGHSSFRTVELAAHLGIAPRRARALLRTLIPVLSTRGIELRERPAFDPYAFGSDACAAEDTAWAAWNLRAQERSAAA